MDKYGFVINKDFLKVIDGVKSVKAKTNNIKDYFSSRRSQFAALTREGYNMCEIAKKFGISRQAVSLALQKAAKEGELVCKTRGSLKDGPNYKIVSRKKNFEIKCNECGTVFVSNKKRKTCSKECMVKSKQKTYGGEWSRVSFVELLCNGCGKTFKRSKYLQRINESKRKPSSNYYCSRECYCNNKIKKLANA